MQTALGEQLRQQREGQVADAVLRSCVHCGFCNATCPTYRLLGDERDGPRGRIYLMKQALEGGAVSRRTQLHLDRCLTCMSCETTCPSGVQYHRLLDIGRKFVDERVGRSFGDRLQRWALRRILPHPRRFGLLLRLGQMARPVLLGRVRRLVPPRQTARPWPAPSHDREMLVLPGCVQPALAPNINVATARVLDRLGISLAAAKGTVCCGALSYHLGAQEEGRRFARANIDAWLGHVENGAEAIVMTASGCGAHVKQYGEILAGDRDYAGKAERISSHTLDISEVLAREHLQKLRSPRASRVAFQSPCSLQHAQPLGGLVERLLTDLGFELSAVPNAHLCCGSAGAYSMLQRDLSNRLRSDKIQALESGSPQRILTANIGCLAHLAAATDLEVRHWIEAVDATLA